jgi:hypothetical protein
MPPADPRARLDELIERLMRDGAFRARFRADPVGMANELGLEDLAADLRAHGNGMQTLEIKESKSSLAGAVMALAGEVVGLVELHALVRDAAIAGHLGAYHSAAGARGSDQTPPSRAAGQAMSLAQSTAGSAAPTPVASPGHGGVSPPESVDLPPDSSSAASPAELGQPAGGSAVQCDPSTATPSSGGVVETALESASPPVSAATVEQLLANPHLELSAAARSALQQTNLDPRIIEVLDSVADNHTIGLSDVRIVTDPVHAQAIDIVSVDGEPVGPRNINALEVVSQIDALHPQLRPNEIGTPWAIDSAGFYSDSSDAARLHLEFTSPSDYSSPADAGQPGATVGGGNVGPDGASIIGSAAGSHAGAASIDGSDALPGPAVAPDPPPAPGTAVFKAAINPAQSPHHSVMFLAAVKPHHVADVPHAPDAEAMQPTGGTVDQVADLSAFGLTYPGDNAPQSAIAKWMGTIAEQHGIPPELPVMAALQESGLHNDQFGDRDSLGYFQMRTSIWDNGPYAGYPTNPALQMQWFINQALAVKQQNPGLAQSPSTYGDWIADIEQPAKQFRALYQPHLAEAEQLLSGSSGSPAAPGAPPVMDVISAGGDGAACTSSAGKALAAAEAVVGGPYNQGNHAGAISEGVSLIKSEGTDCSGFVSYVLGPSGLGIWNEPYTTPYIPTAPHIAAGPGSQITLWDNPAPGDAGHVWIEIDGHYFESAGGIGIHEMDQSEVQFYLASGQYQPFHPVGY